jgi:hypothetical protein
MGRDIQSITEAALALDPESRAMLMNTLAVSIGWQHEFLDQKIEELDNRWKSIESGDARTVSIDEAVQNARRAIAR